MRFIPKHMLNELHEILSKFQNSAKDECQSCSIFRKSVLDCQLGDVAKAGVYCKIYGHEGLFSEQKIALADAIIQHILLCETLGHDINELIELGFMRIKEKSEVRR